MTKYLTFLLIIIHIQNYLFTNEENILYSKVTNKNSIKYTILDLNTNLQLLAEKLLNLIPDFNEYYLINSNYSYSLSIKDGIINSVVVASKTFSNKTVIFDISYSNDKTYNDLFINFFRSYNYLGEKRNFRKISLFLDNTNYDIYLDNNKGYFFLKSPDDYYNENILVEINISRNLYLTSTNKDNTEFINNELINISKIILKNFK